MSDPTPTPADLAAKSDPPADPPPNPPADPPADPPAEPATPDSEPLGDGGKKALQAEREARKAAEKERAEALAKVKEFEDAQLTEQQRLERERDEARESATTNAQKVALYEAAMEYGLTKEDLELLEGIPADQIDARAKRLSERIAVSNAPRNPAPDPTQGARGGGVDIDARIAEAQKAGDFRTVISLQNQKLAEQTK